MKAYAEGDLKWADIPHGLSRTAWASESANRKDTVEGGARQISFLRIWRNSGERSDVDVKMPENKVGAV